MNEALVIVRPLPSQQAMRWLLISALLVFALAQQASAPSPTFAYDCADRWWAIECWLF